MSDVLLMGCLCVCGREHLGWTAQHPWLQSTKGPSPHVLSRQHSSRAARVLLPGHDAMVGVLELELAAAPATVLESEGMGRERGG